MAARLINLNFKDGTLMSWNSAPVKLLVLGTAEIEGRPVDRKGFVDLVHSAIDAGITAFDTASNYQDGRAQRWLIEALIDYRDSINPNFLLSEVAVITKVGQLSNYEWGKRRVSDQKACYYDFSEAFIEKQLEASYQLFKDIGHLTVLLHNPEDEPRFHRSSELARLTRILESWSQRGCFHGWGVSSWSGLFGSEGQPAKFQLTDLAGCSGAERFQFFRAIQVPFGLWNAAQAFLPTQSIVSGKLNRDLFEVARHYGVKIYVNSCFHGGAWLPERSDVVDEQMLAPADVIQICSNMVPDAIRILGASRQETIKANIKALFG